MTTRPSFPAVSPIAVNNRADCAVKHPATVVVEPVCKNRDVDWYNGTRSNEIHRRLVDNQGMYTAEKNYYFTSYTFVVHLHMYVVYPIMFVALALR